MNLLEHYILEVHEVREIKESWGSFIYADLTIDCYGKYRTRTSFPNWEEWEKIKEQGYYMA